MRIGPSSAGLVLAGFALLCGCSEVSGPQISALPVVYADVEVINDLGSTNPDPTSHTTCQTGALLQLRSYSVAGQTHDPGNRPINYEWLDEVEDEVGRRVSDDFGPGRNPWRTDSRHLTVTLGTIGIHYLTLTARTHDGRKASTTLRITVTSCEECGGG